jgi:lipopolysaccharide heptosyltransferase II
MQVKKILFITLSNMGDVILTLPVLDSLRGSFPQSKITVMVGPRPKEVFEGSPNIDRLIIYDKYVKFREKVKLFRQLSKEKFDIVVDLRNTLYGALLPSRYRTSPFLLLPRELRHMKERNLYRLNRALKKKGFQGPAAVRVFYIHPRERVYIDSLLQKNGISAEERIVLVSPGTGGNTRRWEVDKFVQLCRKLSKDYRVILIGSKVHQPMTQQIRQNCAHKIIDFTGLTNLGQLAYLLTRSVLMITGDTGTLQLASYMDTAIVALFGPSDEKKYGPWSSKYRIVKKEIFCRPCKQAKCRFGTLECMRLIEVDDVFKAIESVLG